MNEEIKVVAIARIEIASFIAKEQKIETWTRSEFCEEKNYAASSGTYKK